MSQSHDSIQQSPTSIPPPSEMFHVATNEYLPVTKASPHRSTSSLPSELYCAREAEKLASNSPPNVNSKRK